MNVSTSTIRSVNIITEVTLRYDLNELNLSHLL